MKPKHTRQSFWQSSLNIRYGSFRAGHNRPAAIMTLCSAMAGLSFIFGEAQAQSVPLGEVQNFTIVSSQGVTNAGPTIVSGDVALSPLTTITGFNGYGAGGPGTIIGDVYFNDTRAQNAQGDGLTAYNTLAGKAYLPANDLTGMDLGGMTLTPGVYHFDTSAQLTGTMTLDTLGDSNAVFIFQIGSTLTTSVGSAINLVGGDADVFWQVGSSATINGNSLFNGNVLALASVSFGTGASLTNGRAIALNGAVTLLSNNIFAPAIVLAGPGRYWNGTESNLWTGTNWSSTVDGLDQVDLGPSPDVVFSVNNAPQNQDTVLGADLTISSLTINDTANVTIGGANTLTLSATGLVTGLTVNNGAGLVTINSGLVLGNLSQVVSVNNDAGLVINGVVGGSNGLTKTGAGRLTLTGTNTYTDATVVSGGTLQIGNGVAIGSSIASSNSLLISNTLGVASVLAINLADGETFANSAVNNGQIQWIADGTNTQAANSVFSGTGDMLITGTGTTELLGNNTFSGGTTIDTPGNVLVGNPVGNGSTAFGSGPLSIINGTFDTVDSVPHTISTGGYDQSGGEIRMYLGGTAPGTFTNFISDGPATLTGGTVFVYNRDGSYVPQGGDVQNILQVTGVGNTLTGEFASNRPVAEFFNPTLNQTILYRQGDTLLYPTLTYDPTNADVLWIQDSFTGLPDLTDNQTSVGDMLDDADGPVIDVLVALPPGDLPGIFDLIAPDELTAMFQMGFTAGELQNTNIKRHLRQARQSAATPGATTYSPGTTDSKGGMGGKGGMTAGSEIVGESKRWSVFLEGTSGSASVDSSPNANGYDLDSQGVTLGADMRVSDRFIVGILGTYDDRGADLANGGSIEATGYKGAVYATYFQNNFHIDALVGAGKNSYDTRRSSFGGFANGETDGTEFNALLNAGYDLNRGNWTLSPNASIGYTRVSLDSFTETGSLTPLRFPDQHQESLRSEIGVNLAYNIDLGSVTVTPQVRLAWQHEFADSTQSMSSSFANGSGPLFSVNGPQMDRDRAMFGAGVNVRITPDFSIYGYYDGQLGSSDYRSDNVTVGMKLDF